MGETLVTQLTILGTNIRQDANGRYSLGDCWQLSGKVKSNQPSEWYTSTKTQEFLRTLAGEPENGITQTGDRGSPVTPVEVVKYGPNEGRGFWGNKEAVVHYAMWINPEFCLTVIRAFDAMVIGKGVLTEQTLSREQKINEAFLLSQDIIREKDEEIAVLRPQAEALKVITEADSDLGVRDAGRELQIGQNRVVDFCLKHGWACREGGKLKAAHYGLTKKYCRMCAAPYTDRFTGETKVREDFRLTRKGIERIAYHLAKQLTANREKQAQIAREMELH
nr:KilA-N domain-containing protein [Gluconobacter cerinus]